MKNEPDGFRGIKWGTNIRECDDLLLDSDEGYGVKTYFINDEKLTIGDAKIKKIFYFFFNELFGGVLIQFRGASNFIKLKDIFCLIYGDADNPKQTDKPDVFSHGPEAYRFDGEDVMIKLECFNSIISTYGKIHYFYWPICREAFQEYENHPMGAEDL